MALDIIGQEGADQDRLPGHLIWPATSGFLSIVPFFGFLEMTLTHELLSEWPSAARGCRRRLEPLFGCGEGVEYRLRNGLAIDDELSARAKAEIRNRRPAGRPERRA